MILFDLDGTLVDTAPDLGLALNIQRERYGLPPLNLNEIRPHASHGTKALLQLGFSCAEDNAAFPAMRTEYLDIYNQVCTHSPILFDGVERVLQQIERAGRGWGIVTNKPRRFAQPLLEAMQLEQRAGCLVCADDAARAKPFPDTLYLACQITGAKPEDCIYVGDAERDVQAGRAAGMRTIVALFGYIGADDRPREWGADAMIQHPEELLALI